MIMSDSDKIRLVIEVAFYLAASGFWIGVFWLRISRLIQLCDKNGKQLELISTLAARLTLVEEDVKLLNTAILSIEQKLPIKRKR